MKEEEGQGVKNEQLTVPIKSASSAHMLLILNGEKDDDGLIHLFCAPRRALRAPHHNDGGVSRGSMHDLHSKSTRPATLCPQPIPGLGLLAEKSLDERQEEEKMGGQASLTNVPHWLLDGISA